MSYLTISVPIDDNSWCPVYIDADKLKLPFPSMVGKETGKEDADWIAAFKWYNEYHRFQKLPFKMSCIGCWWKVYFQLKEDKEAADKMPRP